MDDNESVKSFNANICKDSSATYARSLLGLTKQHGKYE